MKDQELTSLILSLHSDSVKNRSLLTTKPRASLINERPRAYLLDLVLALRQCEEQIFIDNKTKSLPPWSMKDQELTSLILSLHSDSVKNRSLSTASSRRHVWQLSSRYDICACKYPLQQKPKCHAMSVNTHSNKIPNAMHIATTLNPFYRPYSMTPQT